MSLEAMQLQTHQQKVTTPPPASGILQRKCACGNHTVAGGECAECRKKRLQRKATNHTEPETVPPIVHEVLRSPGQPLDPATRAFMEPRFGHDFSDVRVHTDALATNSARAVNALAYTVGRDVVFGAGQYAPETGGGKRLLAHELTHVMQQQNTNRALQPLRVEPAETWHERQAERSAERVLNGTSPEPAVATGRTRLQRTIGDGHDLSSNRFARNVVLEAVYDNERILENGDTGTAVRLVQESLLAQGYTLPAFGADGDFGAETEAAVRAFQIDAGARKLDGKIGPETMQLLDMRDPGATRGSGPLATPLPAGAPAPPAATGVVFSEDARESFAGYDASVAPAAHWLVVPVNERRRALTAIAPAGSRPTFVSANPAVATVDVVAGGIVVTGVAAGTTEIRAQAGAVILSRLRIAVKRQLLRSVAFHFVRDSAVPPHRATPAPGADTMRSLLNQIWERQANVQFTGGASHNIVMPGNLGPYVNDDGFGGDEMGTVVAAAPAPANYNVFRVWEVRVSHGAVNNALNNGNNTLIGNAPCADGWGLPHECGHFLGLGHGSGFIMTPCGGRVNQRVSKAMADLVNP